MYAGQGAQEQADRRARKIERLRRDALYAGAGSGANPALERAERDHRNWAAGAEGERLVAETMDRLGGHGWVALHDVRWPGRPRANIDHIIIGPGGVVVVDAKNWTGAVTVRHGQLRQNGRRRQGAVDGAAAAAAAVTAVLPPGYRMCTLAAICLVAHDQAPTATPSGVVVVGRLQLAAFLTDLPVRLAPHDIGTITQHLAWSLATGAPRRVHFGAPASVSSEPYRPPQGTPPTRSAKNGGPARVLVPAAAILGALLIAEAVLRILAG